VKTLTLLDLLVRTFPDRTRDSLYASILCREVRVNGCTAVSPRQPAAPDAVIEIVRSPFVSRGGLKLKHALDVWKPNVRGKIFLDAGSSTGGFTDCLLQADAAGVYAVDVGYNQLAYILRTDPRVTVMERTNIMHIDQLSPVPHAAAADLSFRSIKGAAKKILSLTAEKWMIALIKPQFELDSPPPGFKGVLNDSLLLRNVLIRTVTELEEEGAAVTRLIPSPIPGRKGNREFLALIRDIRCLGSDSGRETAASLVDTAIANQGS
jgi:23S rRNA (cytidine1920-2'-O)/16S rRNA (cytidine1409-2'-O)-methyltransferase